MVFAEQFGGFLAGDGVAEEVLPYGVAGHDDFIGREELLHAFVGHADFARLLGQQFVGDAGVGVLLLYQGGDAHHAGGLQRGSTGIAAYAYGH